MGLEVRGRFKTEGTYAYLWLIRVVVRQKLPIKINTLIKQTGEGLS